MIPIYLQLIRLPSVFTAVSNVLAAFLIGGATAQQWTDLTLLCLASACLYAAGMVLNDCFDLDEDRLDRPQRPLPAGQIPVRHAWLLGWALLGGGVLLTAAAGLPALFVGLTLAGAIVLYDGWARRYRIGIAVIGTCRYLNWLLGFTITGVALPDALLLAGPVFFYTAAISALSKIETTGGDRRFVLVSVAAMALSASMILTLNLTGLLQQSWALLPMSAGLVLITHTYRNLYREPQPQAVQQAITMLVLGIIPLDALLVLNGGPWWGAVAIALLLVPGRLLARRMYVT